MLEDSTRCIVEIEQGLCYLHRQTHSNELMNAVVTHESRRINTLVLEDGILLAPPYKGRLAETANGFSDE